MKTMGSFRDLEDMQMKVGTKQPANYIYYNAPELVKKLKVMMEKKYEKKMKLETKKLMKKFEDKLNQNN